MKTALIALTLLTDCTDPSIGAGLHFATDGLSLTPRISGGFGAARLGLSGIR